MGTKTLLEQAKEIRGGHRLKKPITQEELDLAVAWAKRDVGTTAVKETIKLSHTSVYSWLAVRLREYITKQGV